jgi:hypothetical protein
MISGAASFIFNLVRPLAIIPALLLVTLMGCTGSPLPLSPSDATLQQRRQLETIRQELNQIPPPSKTRYLAVKSLSAWSNPYLTIQGGMVTLHVTVADANTSELGVGGLLRPVGARHQDLNVRASDLPAALNAIPQTAWPYGRVVAVEEAHDAPPAARAELRRNMEGAIKTLGDLGIVVYEWQDSGPTVR